MINLCPFCKKESKVKLVKRITNVFVCNNCFKEFLKKYKMMHLIDKNENSIESVKPSDR